jgi:hypothetical protein
MNTAPDVQRAEGKIRLAIARVMDRYPFHAAVLGRMKVTLDTTIETMAVMRSGEDVLLLHNPVFVLRLPVAQLVGVLLHEVHHVLFRHLLEDPKDFPDRAARLIAEEVTVNEYVTEPLPEDVILLKNYPELPPRESTQQRYERLRGKFPPTLVLITLDNHDVWQRMGEEQPGQGEGVIVQIIDDAATEAACPRNSRMPSNRKASARRQGTTWRPSRVAKATSIGGSCCAVTWAMLFKFARCSIAHPDGSPTWSASCRAKDAKYPRPRSWRL